MIYFKIIFSTIIHFILINVHVDNVYIDKNVERIK